jgi:hypothetical protein
MFVTLKELLKRHRIGFREYVKAVAVVSAAPQGVLCRRDTWLVRHWSVCLKYPSELSLMTSVPFPRTVPEWVSFKQPYSKFRIQFS